MSDFVRPHRQQPTRLPRPWDSPGKNTGVGCHFLLQCLKWKVKVKPLSRARLLATPWTAAHQAPPSMRFSRQEYWSGCHCLLRWGTLVLHNSKMASVLWELQNQIHLQADQLFMFYKGVIKTVFKMACDELHVKSNLYLTYSNTSFLKLVQISLLTVDLMPCST